MSCCAATCQWLKSLSHCILHSVCGLSIMHVSVLWLTHFQEARKLSGLQQQARNNAYTSMVPQNFHEPSLISQGRKEHPLGSARCQQTVSAASVSLFHTEQWFELVHPNLGNAWSVLDPRIVPSVLPYKAAVAYHFHQTSGTHHIRAHHNN